MAVRNLVNWYGATDSDSRLERRRFGKSVKALRQQYNMSRQELANNMNVSIELVDRIERGCVDPNANNLRKKIHVAVTREVMRISV